MQSVRILIVSVIVGIASMVPGLSGAVLAVCLGIYERLVADIADIRHKLRKDIVFIVIVGSGMILGTFIASFGLKYILDNHVAISSLLFLGLIVGQIPSLFRQTDRTKEVTKTDILALIIGLAIMACFLFAGKSEDIVLDRGIISIILIIAIGAIFAMSHLLPGISGTTVMMVLGTMTALMTALTEMDLSFIIPLGVGFLLGALAFSKVVNRALTSFRNPTYSLIIGLTFGSMTALMIQYILPNISGMNDVILGVIFFFVGIVISIALSRLGEGSASYPYD